MSNLLALGFGCLFAFLLLEMFLHVFQPFPVMVKQNDILLPANRAFVFENTHIKKLDPHITCTKNRLGFRGDDLPSDLSQTTSIVAVGGSTAECRLLNDGHDWPQLVGQRLLRHFPQEKIWMNNAGIDGHSTYGHLILLENYLCEMKPDYLLFLTGINEMGRSDLFSEDQAIVRSNSFSLSDWIKKNSETFILANNIYRSFKAYQVDMAHGNLDLKALDTPQVTNEAVDSLLKAHLPYIESYKSRLLSLVEKAVACGSFPILMTQPLLFGNETDPLTGIDLGKVEAKYFNGQTYWCLLEQYNDATRKTALQTNVPLIDLARSMPKDSRYYYDAMHFTNEGAEMVSQIVEEDLQKIIK